MTILEVTNSLVQEFPRVLVLPGDIHSLAYRRRSTLRIGHTATEAIITKLRTLGDLHKPFVNAQQQLTGLVYTIREARALLHRFPTVLFMDCTYQTNKYSSRCSTSLGSLPPISLTPLASLSCFARLPIVTSLPSPLSTILPALIISQLKSS